MVKHLLNVGRKRGALNVVFLISFVLMSPWLQIAQERRGERTSATWTVNLKYSASCVCTRRWIRQEKREEGKDVRLKIPVEKWFNKIQWDNRCSRSVYYHYLTHQLDWRFVIIVRTHEYNCEYERQYNVRMSASWSGITAGTINTHTHTHTHTHSLSLSLSHCVCISINSGEGERESENGPRTRAIVFWEGTASFC